MSKPTKSTQQWLSRQRRDPYVKQAADRNLGSRAHFKLEQLDRRFRLLSSRTGGVLELGAAPGGWTRYVVSRGPLGPIVAVDYRAMEAPANVTFLELDLATDEAAALKGQFPSGVDLVLSDMAPNISGVKATDHAASEALVELATGWALKLLNPGGHLVVKMFHGAGVDEWMRALRGVFERVVTAKPDASRQESSEIYGVALNRRVGHIARVAGPRDV